MNKSSFFGQLSLLRLIAVLAIVLFSFQMISSYTLSEEQELEIVDIDLDDDTEEEIDEINVFDSASYCTAELNLSTASFVLFEFIQLLYEQTRSELHSPPPERNVIFQMA